jgi:hypothetical protein
MTTDLDRCDDDWHGKDIQLFFRGSFALSFSCHTVRFLACSA